MNARGTTANHIGNLPFASIVQIGDVLECGEES